MSLFHGRDVSLNTYQYVFYSYSDKSPNVLQATYYDNSQNLIYSTDISFGSKTVGDMMLFLENSQTNPYALGKDNITPYFRNIDIPFSGLYKKVLTTSHHQLLMSHVNSNYKETYGNAMNIYEVKANGSSNYIIDNISQPDILGSFAGIYVFDQSDSSNSGHILKFRNKSTQAAYEEHVTYSGTPGTLNSFTIIEMDYSTPVLEYYCEYHSIAMYGEFKLLPGYSVNVVTNIVGDSVYALSFPYSSVYYNQPDISFGAGDYYVFDVSDPTMANYNLVFGTIADDATTINNSVVSETNGVIILDIPSGYSGSPLVLFDLSNANMGYVGYSSGVTPVVRLDFGLESDYTNLTNQVDGTQYTDISYTGGLSLNNDELEIAQQNNVTFSNLPPEQFTIMLTYKFTTNNQYWHGISFKQENNNYTVFMHKRSDDNTQYKLTTMKQDNSQLFTFGTQGYPGERVYDIGTQYSFAYVKTDTSLNFFENQSLISSISNDFSLNEFWVNREGNAAIYNTDIAIADVKIFDTAVDVPNYVDIVDNVTSYIVTVSNEVFYIDDVEKLEIAFESSNTYVFDQSDVTNTGQQIVFGYTFDSSNIFVSTDGVQVFGTPGQPGAYTTFTVPSNPSGTIHYYSDGSANMGYLPPDFTYSFTVKNNIIGEPGWASYDISSSVWYNQPDMSFSTPNVYEFDVSDPSNNGYVLSFGTIVDVSDAAIESTYVTRTNVPGTTDAKVLLNLRNYSGDSLVYFEQDVSGLGYSDPPNGITPTVVTVAMDSTNTSHVFYLDSVEKPQFTFAANTTYVFDQSDSSNDGHQLVFGVVANNSANILQSSDGVTIVGTPGRPGAYTQLDLDASFTGDLYYYCFYHTGMGYEPPPPNAEVLIVGGGGQGAPDNNDTTTPPGGGGGGGAGGMISTSITGPTTGYSVNITVGTGGTGWAGIGTDGINGGDSVFDTLTAFGGGGGGYSHTTTQAPSGGSGGGGGMTLKLTTPGEKGGSGISGQGYSGGNSIRAYGWAYKWRQGSGGGGGAGGAGSPGFLNSAGDGGPALQWPVDLQYYAAGGGGGCYNSTTGTHSYDIGLGGDGGYGGGVMLGGQGRKGTVPNQTFGTSGVANTGSGGGSGWDTAAATQTGGADGVVKVWLPSSYTYDSSHVSGTLVGSSTSHTYNSVAGTLVTFTSGSGTWSPVF